MNLPTLVSFDMLQPTLEPKSSQRRLRSSAPRTAAVVALVAAAFGGVSPGLALSSAMAEEEHLYVYQRGSRNPGPIGPGTSFGWSRWGIASATRGPSVGRVGPFSEPDPTVQVGDAVVEIASALRDGLGPAWRVMLDGPVETFPEDAEILITGPNNLEISRGPALAAAASAVVAQVQAAAKDDAASATEIKAAKSRFDDAIRTLRVETRLIPATASSAAEVAPALKQALPWATFSFDSRTNSVIASGTAQELDAAAELVASLDQFAAKQAAVIAEQRARRIESTPFGRFTGRPLTIEFEGGTLSQFLSKLGSESGFRSWIVEDPRAEDALIPPIHLVSVSGDSALRALDGLPVEIKKFGETIRSEIHVQRIDPGSSEDGSMLPVYRIGMPMPATTETRKSAPPAPEVRTEVFLIYGPDGDQSAAAVEAANAPLLAAIEAGSSVEGESSTLRVRLHPPSRMLFVSGTSSELNLVRAIINTWDSQR